jgi:hypothetical protein
MLRYVIERGHVRPEALSTDASNNLTIDAISLYLAETLPLILELIARSWRMRQLFVERLAISEASSQELWPVRDTWNGIGRFRKKSPQLWMVPAERVTRAIPMRPDSGPQSFDLRGERVPIQGRKIVIH